MNYPGLAGFFLLEILNFRITLPSIKIKAEYFLVEMFFGFYVKNISLHLFPVFSGRNPQKLFHIPAEKRHTREMKGIRNFREG